MKQKKKSSFLENKYYWGFFIIISLVPLIWFWGRDGVIVNGVDTNFPLDPVLWFKRRFFVWDSLINGGRDFSSAPAGIIFHGVQIIPYLLGASLQLTELISFVFWFSLIVFSSLFFARTFFEENKYLHVFFVTLYTFNVYLFNTWENVKVANLALVIAVPLLMTLFKKYNDNLITSKSLVVFSSFIGLFVGGAGINPGYFFTVFLVVFLQALVFVVFGKKKNRYKTAFLGLFLSFVSITFVNLYWIIPTSYLLFFSPSSIGSLGDIGLSNWIDSLSQNASFTNLFRLQGAWDWYSISATTGAPDYLDYVVNYFYKPQFIIYSFFIPLLAIFSFVTKRKKSDSSLYILSGVYVILGLFLAAGTHAPTGSLYLLFAKYIPFFSFFRSPWYIFTIFTIIGLSTLATLCVQNVYSYVDKRKYFSQKSLKKLSLALLSVFFVSHLLYTYPLVSGKIFRPDRDDGFYVTYPDYVFKVKDYLQENNTFPRYISYPDDTMENYSWGYRGVDSLTGLFADKEYWGASIVMPVDFVRVYLSKFYWLTKRGMYETALDILSFVGADSIFFKSDIKTLAPPLNLSNFSDVDINTFGKWHIIQSGNNVEKIYTPSYDQIFINHSDISSLIALSPFVSNGVIIQSNDSQLQSLPEHLHTRSVYKYSEAESEDLKNKEYLLDSVDEGEYRIIVEKQNNMLSSLKINENVLPLIVSTDGFDMYGPFSQKEKSSVVKASFNEGEDIVIDPLSVTNEANNPYDKEGVVRGVNNDDERLSVSVPIKEFDPYLQYVLEFEYKYVSGDPAIVELLQNNDVTPLRADVVLTGESEKWETVTHFYDPIDTDSFLTLVVTQLESDQKEKNEAFFRNFSLKPVSNANLYLVEEAHEPEKDTVLPYVVWQKVSPVEYEVEVANVHDGYLLAFLETFSKDWELLSEDMSGEIVHFTTNGFANGWYVPEGKNNQKMTILYKPQKYFLAGLYSSLAWILFVVGYWLFLNSRNNEK